MKHFILAGLITGTIVQVQALTISEVMSNPTGDDNGREWIEVYNEGSTDVDISSMTVSIKGGTAVVTTPLQGGTMLPAGGYVIIGSTVSGSTKFLQDYPSYAGILFKSSISLVNTGVTSIDIKLNGSIVASLPSYTAAKEGSTLSYIGGSYVVGTPTPGSDNQATDTSSSGSSNTASTTTPETQVTLPQMSPPTSDIIIYMPEERVVVAGADSEFSVFSQTRVGKPINDLRYSWAFGDGGQATGSSTNYRYVYPGRYIAQVEAVSATTIGSGRMVVRVVSPDISITSVGAGKYGAYIDIRNPNTYDIDLSQWRITIDGASFPFPKNTWLLSGQTTRFPGSAMGFASTTLSSTSSVKIVFPSLEEVTHYEGAGTSTLPVVASSSPKIAVARPVVVRTAPKMVLGASTTTVTKATTTTSTPSTKVKDTRLVSWIKALLHR